jgi:hypothetical protein
MAMPPGARSENDTQPDGVNMMLQSAHLQASFEPRPIHPDVEKQLRTLSYPSLLPSPATAYFLDRAVASILSTAADDDRLGLNRESLHPRKKIKMFQEAPSLHCTRVPQAKAVRQEETIEYPAFHKLPTEGGTTNLVAVKHSNKPRPSPRNKELCDESVLERKVATIPLAVIPKKTLQRVSTTTSQAAMSGSNEPDSATTKVADVTPPKIGEEDYHTNNSPDDPRDDTNTTHATPSAPWLSRRLLMLMKESERSQSQLEDWDEDHGLPKSHCLTMVSSSRSRRQLQQGVILPKWDGTPLISGNVELGKPRKRRHRVPTQPKRCPNST